MKNNRPQYQKCWKKACKERGNYWTIETMDQVLCFNHALRYKKERNIDFMPIEMVWNYICPNNPKYHRSHLGCMKIYRKGQKYKAFTKPYWPKDDWELVQGDENYYKSQIK